MTAPCPGPDRSPLPPSFAVPAGACDSHMHIFGPAARFPYAARRGYTPPDCTVADYGRLMATLGLDRVVVVQPSVYDTDNACTLDALAQLGEAARGVAVLDPDVSDAALDALHEAGVRGVRFNLSFDDGSGLAPLEALARRIARLGWHVQFNARSSILVENVDRLKRLPVEVVVDHMGSVVASRGMEQAGLRALLDLLATGRTWVKLSGAYRTTRAGPPYAEAAPYARALAEAAPDRCVWGSDWPHPGLKGPMPNDGTLLDLLADWVPDTAARRAILVDNPARLYGFGTRAVDSPVDRAGSPRKSAIGQPIASGRRLPEH